MKNRPTIGLALGSGGAKGLAHIGVLKILNAYQIPIDYIAGASIGSIIGAHYAAFQNISQLEQLFLHLNKKKGLQLFDPTLKGGFIKGKKLEKFLEEILEGAHFSHLQIPFAVVATNYHTAEAVSFTSGNLVKAIRSSISVPAVFQPLLYHNDLFADGGLANPVPVDIVRKMGADIVIAVNLDTAYSEKNIKIPALTTIPMRSINILRHNLAKYSSQTADILIEPEGQSEIGLIGWDYFFNTEKEKATIYAGEKATQQIIPKLQELIKEKQTKKQGRFSKLFTFFYKK